MAIIATSYNAIQFMFFPELIPQWFIRVIGCLFVLYTIGYVLGIQKIYLTKKIEKLDKQISENENYMNEILKR